MDDFRLTVFITAARTLSFTRTAERLGISQPAVSRHVGELEARYRVPLFVRRGGGLELTEAGCVLLDAAERVSDDYRRLEYEMGLCTSQTEGELRLGASTTVAQYLLPVILAHFTTRFPGVRVSMLSGNSGRIEQALADRESVTPAELCRIPLVLRESGSGTLEVIAAALAGVGIRLQQLRVALRLGTTEGIKSFVRHSDAMAILSVISVVEELRRGTLRIIDIEGLTLTRDFSFVHLAAEPVPLARQFEEFARAEH